MAIPQRPNSSRSCPRQQWRCEPALSEWSTFGKLLSQQNQGLDAVDLRNYDRFLNHVAEIDAEDDPDITDSGIARDADRELDLFSGDLLFPDSELTARRFQFHGSPW